MMCEEYPFLTRQLIFQQVIDLRPKTDLDTVQTAVALTPDSFKPYSQIKRIMMRKNNQFHGFVGGGVTNFQHMLSTVFTSLNSLEYLELSKCYLKDTLVVHLPPQLKILNMDENQYQKLNVHWADELEELSAKNNKLANIPKLSVPKPPLKILRLNNNPLKEMTVTDIAELCELQLLELNFHFTGHFVSSAGYCQCTMLKKWAQEIELKGLENVKCYDNGNFYLQIFM